MKNIKELLEFSIINIDKSSGPTSFSVSDYVRKLLGLRKTSHFGTLDPKVTGVLPIALNRACKLTGFFLGHDKEYVGVMRVHDDIELDELQKIIDENFIGKIIQLPPQKSRVKREEREREIKSFELLEKDGKSFLFQTEVQGGTYIRKLIHDLGEKINGAHMLELRRIRAGIFSETKSVNLYDFKSAVEEFDKGEEKNLRKMLVDASGCVKEIMPVVQVKKGSLKQLLTGKPLFESDLVGEVPKLKEDDIFAVFLDDRFIEIARKTAEKEIFGRALFVLN